MPSVPTRSGDIGDVLESLRRKEIITLQTDRFSSERGQYGFVQSVVRQVAYATLSRRDRTTRHLAAADHLAGLPDAGDDFAVVIAQHLLDAVEDGPSSEPDGATVVATGLHLLGAGRGQGTAGRAPRVSPNDLLEVALAHAEGDERPGEAAPLRSRGRGERRGQSPRRAPTPRPH